MYFILGIWNILTKGFIRLPKEYVIQKVLETSNLNCVIEENM